MYHIASVTSDGVNPISFTNIPQTFTHLQIIGQIRGVRSFGGEQLYIRFNSDSNFNYAYHYFYGDGGGVASGGQSTNQTLHWLGEFPAGTDTADTYAAYIIDLLDYTDTNKKKITKSMSGWDNNSNTGVISSKVWNATGIWNSTSAISQILLFSNGAFTTFTRFDLYGFVTSDVTGV